MSGFDKLVFNPFEINDFIDTPLTDCDPDFNFYTNSQFIHNTECDYFIEDKFIKNISTKKEFEKCLGFYCSNIRSLPKHFDELQMYLDSLNYKFPFVGLCETRLNSDKEDLYCLDGYEPIHRYRTTRCGGGVSLLINNDFCVEYKRREDLEFFDSEMESIFIEVEKTCFNTKTNLIICVIYRPPDSSVEVFKDRMDSILEKVNREKKIIYSMGDKNICLLKGDDHKQTSEFIDTLYSHGVFPLITKPTRVTQNTATVIDHIYTNNIDSQVNDNSIHVQGILCSTISDHFSVFHIVSNSKCTESDQELQPRLTRSYTEQSIQKFSKDFSMIDWQDVYDSQDPNAAYITLSKRLSQSYNKCFPLKPCKRKYLTNKPWLTHALKESIKMKNKMYCTRNIGDFEQNDKCYKKYRNRLNHLLRIAERRYYKELIEKHKSNLKKTWTVIKSIINKAKYKPSCKKFKHNGEIIEDGNLIANHFNDFYVNVGSNLAKKIPKCNKSHTEYLKKCDSTFNPTEVSESEVCKIISGFKDSAAGWDELKPGIIKHIKHFIKYPLAHISNISFSTGIFPDPLKLANVVPVYKSQDKMLFSNYRPVSVLPVLSKVLERLMYNRLFDYINENSLLYKLQFGFQKGKSTAMALIMLVDKISEAIEKGEVVLGVFLDFSKAFDTVDHDILIDKLSFYGITGIYNDWFRNYLSNREQYVTYNGFKSQTKKINCGVPQGSILGPLLFLIYINDLSTVSKDLFSILFADDSNMFIAGKNIDDICNKMNMALGHVQEWLSCNKLSLNVLKTHYMFFTSMKRKVPDANIKICNTSIKRVYVTKFLGVQIDSKLTWGDHIKHICKKISKCSAILSKARKKLSRDSLIKLYYAIAFPHFIYCNHVWGCNYSETLKPLVKIQNRLIKNIMSAPYRASPKPLYIQNKLLDTTGINSYITGIFMFQVLNSEEPNMFSTFYRCNNTIHDHETRTASDIHVIFAKTRARKFSIRVTGANLWNAVPDSIRKAPSIHVFKKRLKIHLLDLQSNLIPCNT